MASQIKSSTCVFASLERKDCNGTGYDCRPELDVGQVHPFRRLIVICRDVVVGPARGGSRGRNGMERISSPDSSTTCKRPRWRPRI